VSGSPVTVSELAIAPVKGMRLQRSTTLRFDRHGIAGDREFLIVDADCRLLLSAKNPDLLRVEPSWDPARNLLALRFPDGSVVQDTPQPGAPAVTRVYDGREVPGQVVPGPLNSALSEYLGRPARLFRRAADHLGADDRPVTLMSEASLRALAAEFTGMVPDPRRFRMTITITGTDPWSEHGWGGRLVAIADVTLRILGPVPRCIVTTRNPDSGSTDARVLHALARLRGKHDITFGVWCDIIRPGQIQVGDHVTAP
jgi:uncharacterized protein YcbX